MSSPDPSPVDDVPSLTVPPRARRGRGGRLGDLSDRGLVAYNCGRRMFEAGMDWASTMDVCDPSFKVHLTDVERAARDGLLPSTWQAQWWRGWRDAAERDI